MNVGSSVSHRCILAVLASEIPHYMAFLLQRTAVVHHACQPVVQPILTLNTSILVHFAGAKTSRLLLHKRARGVGISVERSPVGVRVHPPRAVTFPFIQAPFR